MKKSSLIIVSLLFFASMAIYALVRAKDEGANFGASEEIVRVCVDEQCKDYSKTDYRALKDKYKSKISKGEAFTYDEYRELIQVIDAEAKKNPIVLQKIEDKVSASEIANEALK